MNTVLVGDIGGTNARFVLFRDGVYQTETFRVIAVGEYNDLADAIAEYLHQIGVVDIQQASFSFASTHEYQNEMELTNSDLSVSVPGLLKRFGFSRARVVNDFTAAAVGILSLPDTHMTSLNQGKPEPFGPKAVIGPGTGLGVSGLIYTGDYWLPLQSQGGHVSMGAHTARELEIFSVLETKYGHVSAERYLSGIGTVDVYGAICQVDSRAAVFEDAAQISAAAINSSCAASTETMELFCKWLGVIAGDLAVTLGATGGIYIAGGIVPRLGDYFTQSSFEHWLFNKGRFSDFVRDMPVAIVNSGELALFGSYTCLEKHYDVFGFTASS